jgi:hypothetical protein
VKLRILVSRALLVSRLVPASRHWRRRLRSRHAIIETWRRAAAATIVTTDTRLRHCTTISRVGAAWISGRLSWMHATIESGLVAAR